eukprot:4733373-Pleurochrysis_carterae.AAC.2
MKAAMVAVKAHNTRASGATAAANSRPSANAGDSDGVSCGWPCSTSTRKRGERVVSEAASCDRMPLRDCVCVCVCDVVRACVRARQWTADRTAGAAHEVNDDEWICSWFISTKSSSSDARLVHVDDESSLLRSASSLSCIHACTEGCRLAARCWSSADSPSPYASCISSACSIGPIHSVCSTAASSSYARPSTPHSTTASGCRLAIASATNACLHSSSSSATTELPTSTIGATAGTSTVDDGDEGTHSIATC